MFKFQKENVKTTRGMQPSVFDALLPEFKEAGDCLYFDEADMSRPKASQAAKRLTALSGGKKFHSGFDAVKKKVYVRLRMDGEVPDKQDDDSSEAPEQESPQEQQETAPSDPFDFE